MKQLFTKNRRYKAFNAILAFRKNQAAVSVDRINVARDELRVGHDLLTNNDQDKDLNS